MDIITLAAGCYVKKVDLHKIADQWEQDGATASFTVAILYFSLEPIFASVRLSFKSLS